MNLDHVAKKWKTLILENTEIEVELDLDLDGNEVYFETKNLLDHYALFGWLNLHNNGQYEIEIVEEKVIKIVKE